MKWKAIQVKMKKWKNLRELYNLSPDWDSDWIRTPTSASLQVMEISGLDRLHWGSQKKAGPVLLVMVPPENEAFDSIKFYF